MSPNRVVAVLTPLVFAPLAGAIAALTAQHFPGVDISASSLEEIFIAGAVVALAKGAQWTHGWQKHEQREALREDALEEHHRRVAVEQEHAVPSGETFSLEDAPDELLAHDDELDDAELDELEAEFAEYDGERS